MWTKIYIQNIYIQLLKMNIHIGCGYTVGKSWKNYDVTPTARFEKIPLFS